VPMPVGPGVPGGPYSMQMPDAAHAQAQAYQQYMQQAAAAQQAQAQAQAQRAGYMPQQHPQMQQPHPTQTS
jgi:MADS-box transcription factor